MSRVVARSAGSAAFGSDQGRCGHAARLVGPSRLTLNGHRSTDCPSLDLRHSQLIRSTAEVRVIFAGADTMARVRISAAGMLIIGLSAVFGQSAWSEKILPPGFVRLSKIAPSIRQDIRYAGSFNFTGQVVQGYQRADCIMREPAKALTGAQKRLLTQGFELKVFDCYRPLRAVRAFVAWSKTPGEDSMKSIFYPALDKSKLFELGFLSLHSNHTMGIAVDVDLVRAGEDNMALPKRGGRCDGPFEQRVNESSLDFGTVYDCFSRGSATASPNVSEKARANREMLRRALEAEGFRNYPREWWHCDFTGRSRPTQIYDFPIR
jgi:D-alanyl-D-alanine dipeptidase